ncbi:hypothetical protein [Allosphingosinicella deserti]|uniref:hypothetical protein n=1 Tax=Allosphingosinicella deserti TaxID=2116704 RepID=UPI000D0ADC6A|nr:hypothetical protein [Sphingomonas deserti]
MFYRPIPQSQMLTLRIVVIATLDVPATYQVGALMRQCASVMRNECREANLLVTEVDMKMDLTGTLVVGKHLTKDRRRIGVAVTVRVPAMAVALELRDRCEGRVKRAIAATGITGAAAPYIADADNGMPALPTFKS